MTASSSSQGTVTAGTVCRPNLGRQARRQRRIVGRAGLVMAVVGAMVLVIGDFSQMWALLLFPIVASSWLSVLQARTGT